MTNQTIEEIKRQAELAAEWINAKPQGEMSWYMGGDAWYRNAPSREAMAEQLIAANELLQQQQWQPIESAPRKHGFQVLGYDVDVGRYTCEYWQPTEQWVYSWNQQPCQATHFAFLLTPPPQGNR